MYWFALSVSCRVSIKAANLLAGGFAKVAKAAREGRLCRLVTIKGALFPNAHFKAILHVSAANLDQKDLAAFAIAIERCIFL